MQQRLTDFAASLAAQSGLEVGVHFGVGPPAKVINAYVGSNAGSLVVIGSRAEPALSGLGSTALKVVRRPPCPILIVRVADNKPYDKILSAVDLREGSVRAASLAVELFPTAHHQLLYALDAASGSADWGGLGGEPLRLLHESLHAQAERELQQFAQRMRRPPLSPTTCRRGRSWSLPRTWARIVWSWATMAWARPPTATSAAWPSM